MIPDQSSNSDFFPCSSIPENLSLNQQTPPELNQPVSPDLFHLDITCPFHTSNMLSCPCCSEKLFSYLISEKKCQSYKKSLNSEQVSIGKLKAEISLLKQEISELTIGKSDQNGLIPKKICTTFKSQLIPKNLFTICGSPEFSLSYLLKRNIIKSEHFCKKCGQSMTLQGRTGFGYYFSHPKCRVYDDFKIGTIWEGTSLQPCQVMWFMILWMVKAKDSQIASLMELSIITISSLTLKIRKIIINDYLENLPVFSGIVEVDVKNFIKRKIEIGKSKAKERWVIVLVERETKMVYTQTIKERTSAVVLPIIKKRCEVGTIIISESRSMYSRLEDHGYPHYILNNSRGFVEWDQTYLNLSRVYGIWGQLKTSIKRYNRLSINLDDLIYEQLWRLSLYRRYKKNLNFKHSLDIIFSIISKNSLK